MLSSTTVHTYLSSFKHRCIACLIIRLLRILTLRACVLRHVRPDQLQVLCMPRHEQYHGAFEARGAAAMAPDIHMTDLEQRLPGKDDLM